MLFALDMPNISVETMVFFVGALIVLFGGIEWNRPLFDTKQRRTEPWVAGQGDACS